MKADKETMEDLLAEKADASIVNRKVSHDQFDAACDDLTKGLDDALERLITQVGGGRTRQDPRDYLSLTEMKLLPGKSVERRSGRSAKGYGK